MNLFDLSGKTAVVTGGTRGIGLMIARGLLEAGARVYVSSRKPDACADAERELTRYGTVVAVPADLSAEAECVRLAGEISERERALNVLVNNAGATWGAPLEEFPSAAWDEVADLNLKAPFFLTRAFLPLLEAAGTRTTRRGSSTRQHRRAPRTVVSHVFLFGQQGRAAPPDAVLARELGPRHITVNAVAPGPFESR